MNTEALRKEQHILSLMRKTLGNVVNDVAPHGGVPIALTKSTIQEIKDCFGLIAEREKELADRLGVDQPKHHYADGEQANASALNFVKLPKRQTQSA